ncbi:MAG: hypothetical protein AB7V60_05485, partial [Candidatus Caldatribacteriota bacterium]
EANHCDKKILLGNELIEVKRGSFITSETKLADRWMWSRTKVRNFLDLLEDELMIEKISDQKKTVINIVNYDVYQNQEAATKQQRSNEEATKKQQRSTTKNDKNDKNEKKEKIQYAEFVKMTEDEYQKLVSIYGEKATLEMIEILDNYKGSVGKTYKSDYRAILNWVVKRWKEEKSKTFQKQSAGLPLYTEKFEVRSNEQEENRKKLQEIKNKIIKEID